MVRTKIIKRDGRKVAFLNKKIVDAMCNAYYPTRNYTVGNVTPEQVLDYNTFLKFATETAHDIRQKYSDSDVPPNVEQIQNDVVKALMNRKEYQDIAEEYISYRTQRNMQRKQRDKLFATIKEKLSASNVKNQNANVDEHSFGGRMGEAKSVMLKDYALNFCMTKMSRENHLNNEIYIHDLDSYAVGMHNCLSLPFDDLLKNGFNTRQTDVRPAKSINTAMQLVAVLFQLQSLQQFGGVSATHLDWTMVPYVRYSFYKHYNDGLDYIEGEPRLDLSDDKITELSIDDDFYSDSKVYDYAMKMTKKEIDQAVEGMYHNLNTLQSRSGNQLPFTSINYGTCTLTEGRMVIESLLKVSIQGVGKLHRTPIFPCGIFQYMKGVNDKPGTPNYDMYRLALKSTSQRLYPNYVNVDWSVNKGYDRNDPRTYTATMGCRTYNGYDINGYGQLKDGRGNICPVTIILPTLAMEADKDVDKFMKLLDKKIHEAKDMLLERFDYICAQPMESAKFMYENNTMYGYNKEEGTFGALKHGTLALGQLGLAETLQLLIGTDQTTEKGMDLAIRIETLFNKRCKEFKNKYKLNFGVYYTPAENLCFKALENFKKKYGVIKNVSDKEFFTNSMHVPVWHKLSPFKKIDIESKLTGFSSSGCITYVELDGGVKHNIDALETIVNYAMDHDIPYFAINVPNDQCMNCGYIDEINDKCPQCGSTNIRRLRRVTGYLTGDYTSAFNAGKVDEVEHRAKHTGNMGALK